MAETKRVIYYDQLSGNQPTKGDVIFVDNPTTGTHKMDLKSFVDAINNGFDSSIKSSGVSVSADNYSSIITNVNDQPVNSVYTYGAGLQSKVSNLPSNKAMTIINFAQKSTGGLGQVMLAVERNGSDDYLYFRTIGGSPAVWSSWVKVANNSDVEAVREALDNLDIETDKSLSIDGKPADAKAAGDAINDLKADLSDYYDGNEHIDVIWEQGSINGTTGENVESYTTIRCGYIDLTVNPVTAIKTAQSTVVQWYLYDSNQNFIMRQANTINGKYSISSINALAKYVRFAPVTLDYNNVKLIKKSKATILEEYIDIIKSAHNNISNNLCFFIADIEEGSLNTSDGAEIVLNKMLRTKHIPIPDSNVIGFLTETASGMNLMEYDSSKNFVKRTLFSNNTGVTQFNYQSNTAYIRLTWLKAMDIKILQDTPYISKSEKSAIVSGMATAINIVDKMSESCIHHDNFSRTMSGHDMGKNSEGDLSDNSYETLTGSDSDDGVRVDNGLTISADSTRTTPFTLRKISAEHSNNFMVEFNAPSISEGIYIAYKVKDANNFEGINVAYNGTFYAIIQRIISNGNFFKTITSKTVYNSTGYIFRIYFVGGIASCFIDDKYVFAFTIDSIDNYIYIGGYRGTTAHFDFVNMFDLITPLVYNTEYLIDNGISALPNSTISANTNRHELNGEITRFSDQSEHFMLYNSDEKINNGRRTERSLVALLHQNLRTMRYEFDVLFPSAILPDTSTGSYGDIFFQLHDRQAGVSRGHVPFDLALVGNHIKLSQYYSGEQASNTLELVYSDIIADVTYGKWMHFDIYIKERYDERQHPFIELKINGETVYQSRKPNCANDVKGTSAQYGIYKNNFDLITYVERYFDNFKVTY